MTAEAKRRPQQSHVTLSRAVRTEEKHGLITWSKASVEVDRVDNDAFPLARSHLDHLQNAFQALSASPCVHFTCFARTERLCPTHGARIACGARAWARR